MEKHRFLINAELLEDELELAQKWLIEQRIPKEVENVFIRGVANTKQRILFWKDEAKKETNFK